MKIKKIEVCNFKGFRGEYIFDLNAGCKNLLAYGENGSGKSSLYWALKLFLQSSIDANLNFTQTKNIFKLKDGESYVKLSLENGKEFVWSETRKDALYQPEFIEALKASGFIDYKSLLRTYFLPYVVEGTTIDMFPLLNELLAGVINNYTGNSFGEDWKTINDNIPRRNTEHQLEILQKSLENYNIGFTEKLEELLSLANQILNEFEYQIKIEELFFSELFYERAAHSVNNQFVEMKVKFQSEQIVEHHSFLNEAKLSAIAISIYFASLLLTPQTDLRILVLDDVLIGLDMSNRFPIIKLLTKYFKDFQIFLFTYDRAWFDIIQRYMPAKNWKSFELYCDTSHGFEMPICVENKGYLDKAKEYLSYEKIDYKACVVYLRSAFEQILRKYCATNNIPVRYKLKQRKYSSNDFWSAVTKIDGLISEDLKLRVEVHRTHILNPLCHDDPILSVEAEIQNSIEIIEELEIVLKEADKAKIWTKAKIAFGGTEQLAEANAQG